MDRRQLVSTSGLAALATWAGPALAQNAAQHQHQHHGAAAASTATGKYKAVQSAAADCVAKGQVCLAHCLELLATGDKAMAECAQSVNQLLALCGALQALAGQGAALTPALAKVALDGCERCARSCKPHIEHHAECKACYESCLDCAKQCKSIV